MKARAATGSVVLALTVGMAAPALAAAAWNATGTGRPAATAAALAAPVAANGNTVTSSSVTIAVTTAPSSGPTPTAYRVDRTSTAAPGVGTACTINANASGLGSCNDTGLSASTAYTYSVFSKVGNNWVSTAGLTGITGTTATATQLKITDIASNSTSGKFTVSGTTTNKAAGERSVSWRTCVGLNAASSCTTDKSGTATVDGTTGAWSTGSINVANGTTNYTIFVSQTTNSSGTLTDKQSWTQGQTLSF